jgi:hypothetical protein
MFFSKAHLIIHEVIPTQYNKHYYENKSIKLEATVCQLNRKSTVKNLISDTTLWFIWSVTIPYSAIIIIFTSTVHNNQIVANFSEVLASINKENFGEEIHHSTSTIPPRVVAKEPI